MDVIQLTPFPEENQDFFSSGEKKEKERKIEESHGSIRSKNPRTTARLRDIIPQQRDLAIKCV